MSILSRPISIRGLVVPNRLVMAATSMNYASTDGSVTQRMIDFYMSRVHGGVGLIIVENASPFPYLKIAGQLGIWDDRHIPGLGDLADSIKLAGSKVALQIFQPTAQRLVKTGLMAPSSPSQRTLLLEKNISELSVDEILQLENAFLDAVVRVREAGFDAVEFHGAHGHVISSFLSSFTNTRRDEYGGNASERAKFAVEIIESTRRRIGEDFPIIFRLNGSDFVDGGNTVEDASRIAQRLEAAGVSAIHISAGLYQSIHWAVQPMYLPRGCLVDLAATVKKAVHIPVIVAGRINHPTIAEEIVEQGKADMVALSRALLADPAFPLKTLTGDHDSIRPCLGCLDGCMSRVISYRTATCVTNPEVGKERDYKITRASNTKRIVVVGGGPAGLEAARVLATRGHEVTLFEKSSGLGGQLLVAAALPFKNEFGQLARWYQRQLEALNVSVRLRIEADEATVMTMNPDVTIIATGAHPIVPAIPGAEGNNVTSAWDVLTGLSEMGDKIVIIGGGQVGCETALFVADGHKEVTVIEKEAEILRDIDSISKTALVELLRKRRVNIITNASASEITPSGVRLGGRTPPNEVECDSIVVAVGMKPQNELAAPISKVTNKFFVIGDCKEPRKLFNAIHEAAYIARTI